MNIILCIISYFVIGFIIGIVICKIKGKEWCRANDEFDGDLFAKGEFDVELFENNAEGIMICSTFFWGMFVAGTILFSPFLIIFYFIKYIAKKFQE